MFRVIIWGWDNVNSMMQTSRQRVACCRIGKRESPMSLSTSCWIKVKARCLRFRWSCRMCSLFSTDASTVQVSTCYFLSATLLVGWKIRWIRRLHIFDKQLYIFNKEITIRPAEKLLQKFIAISFFSFKFCIFGHKVSENKKIFQHFEIFLGPLAVMIPLRVMLDCG